MESLNKFLKKANSAILNFQAYRKSYAVWKMSNAAYKISREKGVPDLLKYREVIANTNSYKSLEEAFDSLTKSLGKSGPDIKKELIKAGYSINKIAEVMDLVEKIKTELKEVPPLNSAPDDGSLYNKTGELIINNWLKDLTEYTNELGKARNQLNQFRAFIKAGEDTDQLIKHMFGSPTNISPAIKAVLRPTIYTTLSGFWLRLYCGKQAAENYYPKGSHQRQLTVRGSNLWDNQNIRKLMAGRKNLAQAIISKKGSYNFDPNKKDTPRNMQGILRSTHPSISIGKKDQESLFRNAAGGLTTIGIGIISIILYFFFGFVTGENNNPSENTIKTATTRNKKAIRKA